MDAAVRKHDQWILYVSSGIFRDKDITVKLQLVVSEPLIGILRLPAGSARKPHFVDMRHITQTLEPEQVIDMFLKDIESVGIIINLFLKLFCTMQEGGV